LPYKTTNKIINSRKKYDEFLMEQKPSYVCILFFVFSRIGLSQKCNKHIFASDIKAKQKKHKKAQKNWHSSSHARKDKPSGRGFVSLFPFLSILNMKKQKKDGEKND